jgi:membrane-associated phospholipid phosphatase
MRMGALVIWAARLAPPWPTAAALWAVWVGLSRVGLGIHYIGDVLCGYLLGALVGGFFRRLTQ